MKINSSPEYIESQANKIGINIYPTFNNKTFSLLVSDSQKNNIEFLSAKNDTDRIQSLQNNEDKVWLDLMNQTSTHVMQILLSIMNNPELGDGLILIPGINTTCWNNNQSSNFLNRSTPNANNNANHALLANLPLHTDSVLSEHHDKHNELIIGRILHGLKSKPTGYFYIGEDMPDIKKNSSQAIELSKQYGYDSQKLMSQKVCMKNEFEEIMSKFKNIPSLNFNRNLMHSGFTIHAGTHYGTVQNITNNILQNKIAHTGYLPNKNDPSGFMRFINLKDFKFIFTDK